MFMMSMKTLHKFIFRIPVTELENMGDKEDLQG